MTKAIYHGKAYEGILHGDKIHLWLNEQITKISISECDEVYSIKFSLIRNNEDVQVAIEELSDDNQEIFVYTHNPIFAKENKLRNKNKMEYYGKIKIEGHDRFRMIKIDERTKKETVTILTYIQFVEMYNKEVRD